ncbi:hypothetical protein SASPL_150571 [Salvia splendens]|uniref:Peroxidase n=1 Tax=Salvia splendens TaxID=180675 RepID=A0A8X8Z1V4_SALSN|nr:hypothetical protein SASPL_150571 [Salvia splendens]
MGSALSMNRYDVYSPNVEAIVAKVVRDATSRDKTVPATLLRMHFHDCFIRGCDGSILLESRGGNKQKRCTTKQSLHAFYVIEGAKRAVEAVCPAVVSCADILAFAARDASSSGRMRDYKMDPDILQDLSGGPRWDVSKGRKDGRTSKASETSTLPSPLFNVSQLEKSFALRGLSPQELVALLGSHTLGSALLLLREEDPQLQLHPRRGPHNPPLLCEGAEGCVPPQEQGPKRGGRHGSFLHDVRHQPLQLILNRQALFASISHPHLSANQGFGLKIATSKRAFHTAFAKAMIKMSSLNGGQEIRKDCRFVN